MEFEENKFAKKIGVVSGYVFSYLVFTTILFFVLVFFGKIPGSWGYFHVAGITLIIAVIGSLLKRFLK